MNCFKMNFTLMCSSQVQQPSTSDVFELFVNVYVNGNYTLYILAVVFYVYNISVVQPPSWDSTLGTVMSADASFVWNNIKQYPRRPHNTKLGHVNFRSNEPKGCYYVTWSPACLPACLPTTAATDAVFVVTFPLPVI